MLIYFVKFHDLVPENIGLIRDVAAESRVRHYLKLLSLKRLSSTGLVNQSWTLAKSMEKSLDTCMQFANTAYSAQYPIKTTYYEQ